MEEIEFDAEAAVVAALRLFDPRQVLVELLLARERGAVDALEHRVGFVALPVGAGDVEQLHGADLVGALHVRAATEIDEPAVGEERDVVALRDVGETRDLQRLAHRLEERLRVRARHHAALEARVLGDDAPHLVLDAREVIGRERAVDQEVVLELLRVIGAPDVDLRRRERDASRRRPSRARPSAGSRCRPAGPLR